jgi:hypothetical protein
MSMNGIVVGTLQFRHDSSSRVGSPKIKADSSRNLAVFTAQLENTVELAEAVHYG